MNFGIKCASNGLFTPRESRGESEKDQTRGKKKEIKKRLTSRKSFAFASALGRCEWAVEQICRENLAK